VLERARTSKLGNDFGNETKKNQKATQTKYTEASRDYRYIYPDFLTDPVYYYRDKIREKLERQDMINRRKQINVPEFYPGTIMAVTVSDPYSPGKVKRFVGICVRRDDYGLRHNFTLRNVVDGLGVENVYSLYNPTIQKIEILKLEKRLDDQLTYLQDCPPEYSYVPFDMVPIKHTPGKNVPLNEIKVLLNERPWRHRWDRRALQGVIYPEQKRFQYEQHIKSTTEHKPFNKWDMMKNYRETLHDDDHKEIIQDIEKCESSLVADQEVTVAAKKIVKARRIPSTTSTPIDTKTE
jgi:large subunit ribosomal protein L19